MPALSRSFSRLTLAGKILSTIGPILLVLTGGLVVLVVVAGKPVVDFLAANMWLVRFVVAVTTVLPMSAPRAFPVIYMGMKGIAPMKLPTPPHPGGPVGSPLSVGP